MWNTWSKMAESDGDIPTDWCVTRQKLTGCCEVKQISVFEEGQKQM